MGLFCVASNGMNFAFGHFLTTYSVKGSLKLTQQDGARLTSVYYASQVFVRFINIFLVLKIRRLHLVIFYLGLVGVGAATLIVSPTVWALRIGCVLVGLGGGSLFPIGLLWLQGELEVSSQVASLFCVGTTIGAQVFRIPEAAFIDTIPEVIKSLYHKEYSPRNVNSC